ncbi:MAG: hypothetical protein HY268_06825 [Deltaproteobacteria bacterium]|nr:hypothetical protein [Deltaproteobacteria bacterium]
MANLTTPELLEDEIKAVVRAGNYRSKEEAVGHALEVLLAANPHLRMNTAVELYRQSKVTLSRSAKSPAWSWKLSKNGLLRKACRFP